jgi:hypothetical protein
VRVQFGADAGLDEVRDQALSPFDHALACPRHEHDDLDGGDARRQAQAAIVAVNHDRGAQQSRGGAPGRLPWPLQRAVLIGIGDVEGARKVLSQLVRSAHL